MSVKELKKLISKEMFHSKEVFLGSHENIDLDAFASMAGFSLISKKLGKKTYLIIDDKKIEPATKEASEKIMKNLKVITTKEAQKLITPKSLFVILDVNKPKLMSYRSLLENNEKIIVIDHHTKTTDTIKNKNVFIEERASSTCEILAELLDMFRIKIPKSFATIMLGGIVLDTNNFMYKMTRKTFYYCYYLSSKGAEITEAQSFLKQNLEEYVNRSKMIANTNIIGEIALAKGQKGKIYTSQDLAKTADLLLAFKGIKASFAIGYMDKNLIGISARSINKINAGKLMETFGGGGNKNEAAARIENTSVKKIEEELIEKIKKVKKWKLSLSKT